MSRRRISLLASVAFGLPARRSEYWASAFPSRIRSQRCPRWQSNFFQQRISGSKAIGAVYRPPLLSQCEFYVNLRGRTRGTTPARERFKTRLSGRRRIQDEISGGAADSGQELACRNTPIPQRCYGNVQNESICAVRSETGGARGGAREGSPRHSRSFRVASGGCIAARIFMGPPPQR